VILNEFKLFLDTFQTQTKVARICALRDQHIFLIAYIAFIQ